VNRALQELLQNPGNPGFAAIHAVSAIVSFLPEIVIATALPFRGPRSSCHAFSVLETFTWRDSQSVMQVRRISLTLAAAAR
jgi:hypothetical protein